MDSFVAWSPWWDSVQTLVPFSAAGAIRGGDELPTASSAPYVLDSTASLLFELLRAHAKHAAWIWTGAFSLLIAFVYLS